MCTFRQTSRYGDRETLVEKCNHPDAGPDCPHRTYNEYGSRSKLSSHVPSFLSGASTPTTELGPPTPTHEATYATVTRSPGLGHDLFSSERKPHRSLTGHRRKHRHTESTTTQNSLHSQPAVMVMDPPQGPPKGPPNRRAAAAAADRGSDSEGSRRKRRPPPIDTSLPAANLPTFVHNDASASSLSDDEYTKAKEAKETKYHRAAAAEKFESEERRREREREEKAKDDYYAKFEAPRGDYRAQERARKAREREEREKQEREAAKETIESDDYAKSLAERQKLRDAAREPATEDQSSPTMSSGEYSDRIRRGQTYTEKLKRSPSPERARTTYSYTIVQPPSDDSYTPRSDSYPYSRLFESEYRQTFIDRSDRDRPSPARSYRHRSEPETLMSMKAREALLEAEMRAAEGEARIKSTTSKRQQSIGDPPIEIGRDSKGNLVQRRRHPKGTREDFQKRRVRIFNL